MSFVADLLLTVTRPECVTNSLPHFPSSDHPDHILFCFFRPIGILVRILREPELPFSQWRFSSIV